MRSKRLAKNTVSSLSLQLCTIICGFILPRLILKEYGSDINGLVNSIGQFLSFISLLELGVGAVVQSALYKPLAEKESELIDKILTSAGKFFKRIGQILFVYVIFLMTAYPIIVNRKFGHMFTATLILAMSISYFAQYYFGIVDRLLLTADQKGYIQYRAQTLTLIVNTILCVVFIKLGFSIHMVKLASSLVFLVRPVAIRFYVKKFYSINRKAAYTQEPISQKWNGISQHVSAVILDETDTIVLTVLSTLANVSIYSVYNMVVSGIRKVFVSLTSGAEAAMGEMWAKKENEELHSFFKYTQWSLHTAVIFIFGCTASLIVPFVSVYTKGVDDANYIQPLFAMLILIAQAVYCLRLPFHILIKAAGHYKQTQNSYMIAAAINIVSSCVFVKVWGLVGVAIGTIAAMTFQTLWMAVYCSKNLMKQPFASFVKQILIDALGFTLGIFATQLFSLKTVTYFSWLLLAVRKAAVWVIIVLIINLVFCRKETITLFRSVLKKLHIMK